MSAAATAQKSASPLQPHEVGKYPPFAAASAAVATNAPAKKTASGTASASCRERATGTATAPLTETPLA